MDIKIKLESLVEDLAHCRLEKEYKKRPQLIYIINYEEYVSMKFTKRGETEYKFWKHYYRQKIISQKSKL
jgi:hypothetical protein|tara:strand:- start:310 stop:519 length:210 start_codon:yes stop_codon:yes gene_type:complete